MIGNTFISPSTEPVTKNNSMGCKAIVLIKQSCATNVCNKRRWRTSNKPDHSFLSREINQYEAMEERSPYQTNG